MGPKAFLFKCGMLPRALPCLHPTGCVAVDGSLCCPASRITFSTGEVHPLPPKLLLPDAEGLACSEDGQKLIKNYGDKIELLTREGKRLRNLALSLVPPIRIRYYSSECGFVIYVPYPFTQFSSGSSIGLTKGLDVPQFPRLG